jgi:hypothetical protein
VAVRLRREKEEQGAAVRVGAERTGAIAAEKMLGGITGGGTAGGRS